MYIHDIMSIKTGIIGASGYTGAETLRILSEHPEFKVVFATGASQAGTAITALYPHLNSYEGMQFRRLEEISSELNVCDLIFCGLPHGEAMKVLPALKNKVVIDLGGDFRLSSADLYQKWYGHEHTATTELGKWQYGLPELFREQIKTANRIANPGCFPTAATLATAPLVKDRLIASPICVDAMSGTSGAGRTLNANLHVSHVLEDLRAYKVTKHQHTPEMEMALQKYSGENVIVSFTAHLAPMVRGIHATCSAQVRSGVTARQLVDSLKQAYKNEKFVRVSSTPAGTKEVRASNFVVISAFLDERSGRAIITCVIDNLVKGAAGQAVQNANIIFGLEENLGLKSLALYP